MDEATYTEWLKTSTSNTAAYLKANTVDFATAKGMGFLPEQQRKRHLESIKVLEAYGHGNSPECKHLRWATR